TWGSNISSFRFNRVWPAIVDAADEDIRQSVTFVSEGSQWDASNITSTPMAVTLRANGQSGAPIQARIQVFAALAGTFYGERICEGACLVRQERKNPRAVSPFDGGRCPPAAFSSEKRPPRGNARRARRVSPAESPAAARGASRRARRRQG